MHTLAWALLVITIEATLSPDTSAQTGNPMRSVAILVPNQRIRPQQEMLAAVIGKLRASGLFSRESIIEFPAFRITDRKATAIKIRELRERAFQSNTVICIGSEALIPFLMVRSELPDSVELFSLGVLGVAHSRLRSKRPPLPNLYRLRGAISSDISLMMAILFTEQIRTGAGPYGAILSKGLPERLVDEAMAMADRLGTSLQVERIDSLRHLEAAAIRLMDQGIRTFIKLPDPTGIGDKLAAPVVSRIRLQMTRRGIAIMGLGPGDKDGAFGYVPDYAQAARDLAEMILNDLAGVAIQVRIRTPTRVIPYVRSPVDLHLVANWEKRLSIAGGH